jgi:hypothetical protein
MIFSDFSQHSLTSFLIRKEGGGFQKFKQSCAEWPIHPRKNIRKIKN